MADTCIDLPLIGVVNDNCNRTPLGKQPVMVLYQEMSGTPPELVTGTATTRLAALQAAITATTPSKIFVINNLANGLIPAATDQTQTGNGVPRGGTIVTGRDNTMTATLNYLTPTASEAMDKLNQRGRPVRAWIVDDTDIPYGPIENFRMSFGTIELKGIGGDDTSRSFLGSWRSLNAPAFAAEPLAGVSSVENA